MQGRPALAPATSLWALTGFETVCPANMPPPLVFMVAFSTDTLGSGLGFRRAEVRSAYLVQYAKPNFQQPIDTLRQPAPGLAPPAYYLYVYYDAQQPPQFAVPANGSGASTVSFRLEVPSARCRYDISDIVLEQAKGTGRCEALHVTRREALINGERRDGLNQPPALTK